MNRLQASLSAALVVSSSFFFASTALADEEPVVETTPIAQGQEEEAPKAEEAPVAAVVDFPVVASPVDADAKPATSKNDRMRVGALVGIGFPRPLSVEGFVKVNRMLGVGAEYGFLPRTNISSAEIEMKSVAGEARFFPFKNGFFVGLRGGRQWIDAGATAKVGPQIANASMHASTWFVNPRIGVLHTFENGITLGVDVGVQIPISPELAMEHSNTGPKEADAARAMRSVATTLGNETTPTIDLLRVGFLF